MATYSTNNRQAGAQQVTASTFKTLLALSAATATLRRAWLYEFEVGQDAAPAAADGPITWDLSRSTTLGTGTAATPSPVDLADPAAGTVSTVNMTVEPTIGVSLLAMALNQRNSQRWIARDEKSALIVPAANLAGIALRALSPVYVGNTLGTVFFNE